MVGVAVGSAAIAGVGFAAAFWLFPAESIGLPSDDPEAVALGAISLRVVGHGIPFAGSNLVGSRTFVGLDDARTPTVIRAGARSRTSRSTQS